MRKLHETMDVRPITIEDVIKYNPLFAHQTWFSKDRDVFFADYQDNPQEAIKKWTEPYKVYNPSLLKTIVLCFPPRLQRLLHTFFDIIKKQIC